MGIYVYDHTIVHILVPIFKTTGLPACKELSDGYLYAVSYMITYSHMWCDKSSDINLSNA